MSSLRCAPDCVCGRHDPDLRAKQSAWSSERVHSPETRAKMRASMLARTAVPGLPAVHFRLASQRGKARAYDCVDCGGQAAEWSYDGGATPEFTSERGDPYSTNLDAYSPRCVTCHRRYDSPLHPRRSVVV